MDIGILGGDDLPSLTEKHRVLDEEIRKRHGDTGGLDPILPELKRKKLQLKDLITRLESTMVAHGV